MEATTANGLKRRRKFRHFKNRNNGSVQIEASEEVAAEVADSVGAAAAEEGREDSTDPLAAVAAALKIRPTKELVSRWTLT